MSLIKFREGVINYNRTEREGSSKNDCIKTGEEQLRVDLTGEGGDTYSGYTCHHQLLLSAARQRWLHAYGLYEVKVSGDGNCQFGALSDQMFRSPEYHKHIRKDIVKQLKDNRSMYEGYVPMKYKRYYKQMAKSGEWGGDHVTLQAAADKFAAKICLLTSFRDACFIEIMPQNQAPKQEFWLSFWSEVHYRSLYDLKDAPIPQKPRRKHWLF